MKNKILILLLILTFSAYADKQQDLVEKVFENILIRFDGELTQLVDNAGKFGKDEYPYEVTKSCYTLSLPKVQKFAGSDSAVYCDGCFGADKCDVRYSSIKSSSILERIAASGMPMKLFKKPPNVMVDGTEKFIKSGWVKSYSETYYLPAITVVSGKLIHKVFECNLTYGISLGVRLDANEKPWFRTSKIQTMMVCPKFDLSQHILLNQILNHDFENVGEVFWQERGGFKNSNTNKLNNYHIYLPVQHKAMPNRKDTLTFATKLKVSRKGLKDFKKQLSIDTACRRGHLDDSDNLTLFECESSDFFDLTDLSIIENIKYKTQSEFANGVVEFKALPFDKTPCSIKLTQNNKKTFELQFDSHIESEICFAKVEKKKVKQEAQILHEFVRNLHNSLGKTRIKIDTKNLLNQENCKGLWNKCGVVDKPSMVNNLSNSYNGDLNFYGLNVNSEKTKGFLHKQGLGCKDFKFFENTLKYNHCYGGEEKMFGIGQFYKASQISNQPLLFSVEKKSIKVGEKLYASIGSHYGNNSTNFSRCISLSKLSDYEYLILCSKKSYLTQNEAYIRNKITPISFNVDIIKNIKKIESLNLKSVEHMEWSYVTKTNTPSMVGMMLPLSKHVPIEFPKPDWMAKQGYADFEFAILFTKNSDVNGKTDIQVKKFDIINKLLNLKFSEKNNFWFLSLEKFNKILSKNKIKNSKEKIKWLLEGIKKCIGGKQGKHKGAFPSCYKQLKIRE